MNHPTTQLIPYETLRREVKKTLLLGQQKIEREKVRTYWKTGKLIDQHIKTTYSSRPDFGKRVVIRLSRDLGIAETVLYRCIRFAQCFPNLATWPNLSWSHYRILITLPHTKQRLQITEQANSLEWSVKQLEDKIREIGKGPKPRSIPRRAKHFIPKRGRLHTYRIVRQKSSTALFIDLGFSSFVELPKEFTKHLKENDIVEAKSFSDIKIFNPATSSDLYTYRAELERVIDGDTVWMRVHLGFNFWLRQKLRLRDLDAAELGTKEGEKAKRFVEDQLKNVSAAVVTTTKPDKYDRYLSDIWIGETNLNRLLLQHSLACLKRIFSHSDWDDTNLGRF